jgi:hypothetical protein
LLSDAFALAATAHGIQRRPSDGRLFLEHVTEVAGLLQRLDFDEELVAVGLLHDTVFAADKLSTSPGFAAASRSPARKSKCGWTPARRAWPPITATQCR